MTWVDALVLLWVALSAVIGYQRGLSAQLLSLAGLAIGGLIGARVGPLFLPGGDESPWVPFASLIGAVVGALLQATASLVGTRLRWAILRSPLRLADSAGGVVIGIGVGLAVAWLAAVAALQIEEPAFARACSARPSSLGSSTSYRRVRCSGPWRIDRCRSSRLRRIWSQA